ncbi:PILR alpha-associated neural protein [Hemicordylus capensis]|uniref:PILR alpha-associated neural protein n=1 Tax=Hemicordylus capensis TaxID=884348 RepID=UPI00230342C4|nr:PILR alpha-associated neural protein [Hemicordylus capensis]XP_053146815.1 PILR alpha-associated neural protein [Hemicordylus capensis]
METSTCVMLPLVSCFRLLQLWPFLLLASAVPPHSAWSLRSRGLPAARPLCGHRSPSAPRSVCAWDKSPPPDKGPPPSSLHPRSLAHKGAELRSAVRLRRQAQGTRPATPSGFEDGLSSSQYPWAIVWGPTISVEDGGDANSANPGFPPPGYTFVSSSGMATVQPNSHSLLHNEGLNLRQTPATLRPFLFGPRGEGVDPQLYVTITISVIIVLVAMGIILKFCWDRNQKRRRHSSQQSGLRQQGSQQPLTDLSPASVSILGPYGDSQAPTPEMAETGQGLEGTEKLEGLGKTSAFQLNRIPLVNL